jgi:hypothetical protein
MFPAPHESGSGPTLATWALEQVVGRDANVVAKAARDPKLPSQGGP